MIKPGTNSSERLMNLQLNTTDGPVTLISVYAPTLNSPPEDKDKFYEDLSSMIDSIPSGDQLYLLGDFNARVGNDVES